MADCKQIRTPKMAPGNIHKEKFGRHNFDRPEFFKRFFGIGLRTKYEANKTFCHSGWCTGDTAVWHLAIDVQMKPVKYKMIEFIIMTIPCDNSTPAANITQAHFCQILYPIKPEGIHA